MNIKLSELNFKEIINLQDGARIGSSGDYDLSIDENTGTINSLIVNENRNFLLNLSDSRKAEIPWESIKKIGEELIVIELDFKRKGLL